MSNESTRYPGLFQACQRKYKALIDPIRAVAKEHGYSIGVHGSVARDIDLIAVPWTEKALPDEDLVKAIISLCQDVVGSGFLSPADANPELKPHGRKAWSIHLGAGVYIDLSIMPRIESQTEVIVERKD